MNNNNNNNNNNSNDNDNDRVLGAFRKLNAPTLLYR